MAKPVFFDPSGARRRWSLRGLLALLLLLVAIACVFATTILNVPAGTPLPIRFTQSRSLPDRISAFGHRLRHIGPLAWLPQGKAHAGATGAQVSAFYVPWDEASATSLRAHVGQVDAVIPASVTISGPHHLLQQIADPRLDAILAAARHRPAELPMVQNLSGGQWDGAGAAALFASPQARRAALDALSALIDKRHAAGVVFDFESLPERALPDYRRFLAEARARFSAQHRTVSLTVPAGDPAWNLAAFARVADTLYLMDYDQHWQGGTAGPIAAQPWFVAQLRAAIRQVGAGKLVVAFGSYGYDWHGGQVDALTLEEAWLAATDSGATPVFDPASGNSHFSYADEGGTRHDVWMLDAGSAWNQLRAAAALGTPRVALWRLGSEDPGVWSDLDAWRHGGARPDLSAVRPIANVDVEGNGEILRITDTPRDGARQVAFDRQNLVRDVRFSALPSPFVVQRTGAVPREVALTFDDGPDPTWTPRILDVLKAAHVPATFFVIGENGLAHPLLLRRIVAEGHEIGNHSYTHPNMAFSSDRAIALEVNATQRLIEAYTGRATHLFRAPYFGDAEPTTAEELQPALVAQSRGYTVVGLHVDPGDWQRPGVDAIVDRTIAQVAAGNADRSGNVILLHDGGGDRAETVAALPRIIAGLRARGFRFVPVSHLAGLSQAQVMPRVSGGDLLAVRADVGVFALLAGLGWLLDWLFFAAITLGIGRALLMAALALWNKRHQPVPPPPMPDMLLSVIIPAFNEERVICAFIARVLASTDATLEVIVADDGSSDNTSGMVRAMFDGDPQVRVLTLANGGKAAALNRALVHARGEIVVALDADTQFEPETVARLVRWFADPGIGAVAGNAKVGNRVNLATRWQAVEYVTAQNVERRALAQFDAMTVVPGAVGAWRRAALDAVGGYPEDTLAEDQDLTIAVQRAGWRIAYDVDAVAWTEAPESFRALARQRFRWAFGTLQCLWKHRGILRERRPQGLAFVGLPQAWLFQIVFAAISPLIDLALVTSVIATAVRVNQHGWAQTRGDVGTMAAFWIAFTAIDVICGWIAFRLEPRERRYPAHLLVAQRLVYRQLMYWVVCKAIASAIAGFGIGWGKLERTGRVAAAGA
ncbi:polysaccharide deacetylase family protein [Sphingomonas aracearum]|uniref:Chitooligosaccharide deacetylase n=1 Tax=Sphingomonas aracearum TaxID=2283317 RepID=A0A369W3W5_9SPHN|nr:glycosyltransferase [Sphingomonas aracearum]RDE06751.1 glycosyltransferase [Sphingomonas aracearum]